MPLAHTRAELLAQVHHTHRPSQLPASGKKIAYQATRAGVAERVAAPAVQQSLAVERALITSYDERLRDVELTLVTTAKHHDATTLSLLPTVPGIGTMLSLVRLYAIHQSARFPRVQDGVSSCPLVTCAREAAGKRYGTSGTNIGQAHLTGAFAEAAVLGRRDPPAAQTSCARVENKHDKGQARTILAHK